MLWMLLAACDGTGDKTPPTDALAGPELVHTAPSTAAEGVALDLTVTATDDDGVASVSLRHRVTGQTEWVLEPMEPGDDDLWTATLEADSVAAPGLEYYFEAIDANESPARTYLPAESTSAPYELAISVDGNALPFVEDFELDEGQTAMGDLGWQNASEGFLGYGWALSDVRAHGGSRSVYHSRGYTGTPAMADWLISPPLDFSAVTDAQVSWHEYGVSAERGTHALYISTGSFRPDGLDYELVAETLPTAPEAEWGRSPVVDLSAWAGSPVVYLAWVYAGVDQDDWSIDDVRVEPLQAELGTGFEVTPAPIAPDEDGALTVTVSNTSSVDAADVTVSVAFPSGGASVAEASVDIPGVAAGSSEIAAFALHVDASTPDNSRVPVTVTIALGDTTTVLEESLLVGVASVATIVYTPSAAGSLELVLGVGDPAAPAWEQTVYSADATSTVTLAVDVTDRHALLPPVAGADRWFVRATGEVAGRLDDFSISWDGATFVSEELPAAPAAEAVYAYVPTPPSFEVSATAPDGLSPGAAGNLASFVIENAGSATQGAVTAWLTSADPDVVIGAAGPVDVTAGTMEAGDRVTLTEAFSFDVSSAHTDSTDVTVELVLSDEVESWTLPVAFAVPFPVMRITAVVIDDEGGDGILDPGETADIELSVTNVGDLTAFGSVSGSLSAEASSTVTATVATDAESYGLIGSGSTKSPSDPWTVAVTGGAEGDELDLLLTLTDSERAYEVRTTLILGEPPWTTLDVEDDATGDALAGWDFDLVGGEYRVMDGVLQIRLSSATVFDPSALFIESWGMSSGGEWSYYRLVLQSGIVTMQGYGSSGFVDISTPTVSYPDATSVLFEVTIADLGLLLDQMDMGFATGWCGPDTYYCDHFPDGWGYPYISWSPSLFFELSW